MRYEVVETSKTDSNKTNLIADFINECDVLEFAKMMSASKHYDYVVYDKVKEEYIY